VIFEGLIRLQAKVRQDKAVLGRMTPSRVQLYLQSFLKHKLQLALVDVFQVDKPDDEDLGRII